MHLSLDHAAFNDGLNITLYASNCAKKAGFGISANVGLLAKVHLLALLARMQLRVTLVFFVLGWRWGRNQRGIYLRTHFQTLATGSQ
jgi:hypothetical protein